ncbi:MAG: TadE/TadG family type IV pilus assembly protein [Myxococcota bacterium]
MVRRSRGAAALEFVLILPFLLLLMAGMVDGALFFSNAQRALLAASAGARAGATTEEQSPIDGSEIVNAATQAATDQLNRGAVVPALHSVRVEWLDRGGHTYVIVTVEVESQRLFPSLTPFPDRVSRRVAMMTVEQLP